MPATVGLSPSRMRDAPICQESPIQCPAACCSASANLSLRASPRSERCQLQKPLLVGGAGSQVKGNDAEKLPFVLFVAGMRNLLTRAYHKKIAFGLER